MNEDNNTEYINFIQDKNSLFYKHGKGDEKEKHGYNLPKFDPQLWNHYSNLFWSYMIGKNKLPDQGWKIHITANLDDAQEELQAVSEFLIQKNITFKYIPSREGLIHRNSKYGGRVESGKFITIYPKSKEQFVALLPKIESVTNGYKEGPYVLNDMQWHDSNVFFRYGAFKKMVTFIDGEKVMAIKSPDGTLVEDKRVPYFYLPDFEKIPDRVQEENKQSTDPHTFDRLREYTITNALHYSNAGGVYLATKDEKRVVLKEGRPHAGIDAEGLDGFDRIRKEYQYLHILQDIPEVVNVSAYFKAWKHNYLCEDYVTGETLVDYIVANYPAGKNVQIYSDAIQEILGKLVVVLERVHKRGVAIGDLQPANILVEEDESDHIKIHIIDLESAHETTDEYNPGLATPGYVNLCSSDYSSADWFALFRISRYAFLPIETGTDLAPAIEEEQNKNIKEHFGSKVVSFMNRLKRTCYLHIPNGYKPPYYKECLQKPQNMFSIGNIKKNINDLYRGIEDHLDYASRSLIKGDIQQYSSPISQYSIANGAFGGIMSIERSKQCSPEEKSKVRGWISNNLEQVEELSKDDSVDKGLYTGLSGIAAPLFEMGYEQESKDILNEINFDSHSSDVSIYSGLSGIGMANLAMYKKTRDIDFLNRAKEVKDQILASFDGDTTNSGLLDGWLGASFFLWNLAQETDNDETANNSIKILDVVIKREIVTTSTGVYLRDDNLDYQRLMPYLNRGTAGLGYLILKIKHDNPNFVGAKYDELLQKLVKTTNVYITYMDCLFDGMAGLMVFDQLVNKQLGKQYGNLELKMKLLNNYMIGKGNETLVPGRFGYKCSMDVETGAAGVLLVLSDIYHGTYESWLPVI